MSLMHKPSYIVERFLWQQAGDFWLLIPGADRIETFGNRAEADAFCRELEWNIRRQINPFTCGGPFLHYQTRFDAARLFDWCLDAGLDPPMPTHGYASWANWWEREHKHFSDLQRVAMWEALDRVRFFHVREREAGLSGHLVAIPHEEENPFSSLPDRWHEYVGSSPYMFMCSASAADDMCQELYVNGLARQYGFVGSSHDQHSWERIDVDPFHQFASTALPGGSLFHEYAERRPLNLIVQGSLHSGQDLFVVLRRTWRLEPAADGCWRWSMTRAKTCGKPVVAFDTLTAADACMAQLEGEAREMVEPFRFGPPHEWSHLNSSAIWGMLSDLKPIPFTSLWEDYRATDQVWVRWWDSIVPSLTAEQIAMVWSLYDRLRFYEVVAVEYRE